MSKHVAGSTDTYAVWVDKKESFYCELNDCNFSLETEPTRNTTQYKCEHIKCACVPGRKLCGAENFINIDEFLSESLKGPATFVTVSTEGGSPEDGSKFKEPAMDDLISSVFGDESILLDCDAGECLYQSNVPGYEKPVRKINTPLIAGVIAGCALFIVGCILLVWYLSRRSTIKQYGPLYLQDPDDESSRLIADHKPTALHFHNVCYQLNGKQILSGVQGAVRPGEILAIMGASGAGKTTFLDILARKNKKGLSDGQFYINGEQIGNSDFRSVIGFVDQDDTMLATLTVHETILDSALLRLPKTMHRSAKEQRVEEVEKQLGIFAIRDQLIGSEEGSGRGISGGEKRRVGIACELVTSPSILFLDEPTSGLDAYNAFNVVECLVNLVKTYNRTVVFTIHQPRSNIVALFDQLVLLAKGRAVYSGPFSSCQSYFDSIGYSCPPGFNIADYLVDLTMHAAQERTDVDDLIEGERNDNQTRSSSVMAVKSVASISGFSMGPGQNGGAGGEFVRRPANERKMSLKQKQDEQLFGRPSMERASLERASLERHSLERHSLERASGSGPASPVSRVSEDTPLNNEREASQAWVQLSRKAGLPPGHLLRGEEYTPPELGATGTDLDYLVTSYRNSDVAVSMRNEMKELVSSAGNANGSNGINGNGKDSSSISSKIKGYQKVGLAGQFAIISLRIWRNLYRNPMLLLTHYAISIVLAVLLGGLYYGLADDLAGFQNRLGLLFFILALFGFSTLTTLTVFAGERLLFVRERAKGYYHPISYFAAKVIFDIVPLRLIPPVILGVIVYPMTGLLPDWSHFWRFMMFLVLFNFAAAAICLFIGIIFKNAGVANLIGSLTMLFSLLFAGFLLNHDKIPKAVIWLQNVSLGKSTSAAVRAMLMVP